MTVKDIVDITGGRLLCGDENTVITDMWTNSREVKEGDLFVPIKGENVDGHDYIPHALQKAAATLTERRMEGIREEKPYIYVPDAMDAIRRIGKHVRKSYKGRVIGVTGSVGKTTTRQMIAAALSGVLDVYQTQGNLNSQIGVPITLSRIPGESEISVLEMGISETGHMDILADLVRPDIAVVSTIGVAHIEYLKTRENIRKEKLKIAGLMDDDGVLFLNGDDEMLADMRGRTSVKTFFYGTEEGCDYRAENIEEEDNYMTSYDFCHGDMRLRVQLNALGRHNVENSVAGLAIVDYLGLDVRKAAEKYRSFEGMRQRIINTRAGYTIIDDTYNASPDSMKASIDVLCGMRCSGRRVAVLGDMFELGENSRKYHYEVGKHLAEKDVYEAVLLGEDTAEIERALKENGRILCRRFGSNEEAAAYLSENLKKGDTVLLKGSNGMHLGEIVKAISDSE